MTLLESGCTQFYNARLASYLYSLHYTFPKNTLQLILSKLKKTHKIYKIKSKIGLMGVKAWTLVRDK